MENKEKVWDKHKSPEKDDTHVGGKTELKSLQRDEATEKGQHHMGEHLDARLMDSSYGKHGMKSHLGHAMAHMHKEHGE